MSASVEEFLTVADVAAILRLNQQTVRNWIDDGKLPAIRVGRRVRIKRSDFEQLIEQGRMQVPPEPEPPTAQAFWEGDLAQTPIEPTEAR